MVSAFSTQERVNEKENKNVVVKCKHCQSQNFVKEGFRKTQNRGKIQKYYCMDCKKYFTADFGFYRMRNSEDKITSAIDLYFSNLSSRKVRNHFNRHLDHNASHVTVLDWCRKYVLKVQKYVDTLQPSLSGEFYADETEIQAVYQIQSSTRENTLYYINESYKQINNGTTSFDITTNATFALIEYQSMTDRNDTPSQINDITFEPFFEEAGEPPADATAPTITLNYPLNGYINDTGALTLFNCSATDANGVFNISLWLTNSTNQTFSFNMTNTSTMLANSFNSSYNMSYGNYTWNCLSCDSLSNCGFSTANRTLEIKPYQAPPSDTCTYSGTGTWNVDCSDSCDFVLTDVGGEDVNIGGVGIVRNLRNIYHYGIMKIYGGCVGIT